MTGPRTTPPDSLTAPEGSTHPVCERALTERGEEGNQEAHGSAAVSSTAERAATPYISGSVSGRYATIVADPPWHYDNYATMPGNAKKQGHVARRDPLPYDTLTVDEIAALPARDLCDPIGCRLFLWTTNLYLPQSFGVIEAWGFSYAQTLVWHKTGNPSPFGGSVAPNHAEYLIVGTVGKPELVGRLAGSVIAIPKPYEHSKKPEAFLDLIESISPGPYLEMFSRRSRLGWDVWGNEVDSHVEMAS